MKIKNTLLVISAILLALLTIRTCKLEKELNSSNEQLQTLIDHPVIKTDTFYTEASLIKPPKQLPNEIKPFKVTIPTDSKYITHEQKIGDTIRSISDGNKLQSHKISLGDSIIGIDLNKNKFTLTFTNPYFGNHTANFNIKPEEYQYVWVDGKLTTKRLPLIKRLEFHPYTSVSYRPIHNLWDWELGISFKTKSLNYNFGVNAFYYPKFQNNLSLDAVIRITYNF